MTVQLSVAPNGMRLVTMTEEEYQDLVDARDHALAMNAIKKGEMELIDDEYVDAYLAAPTPLAFWREYRNLRQEDLAEAAGVSQAYIAMMEAGTRAGAPATLYAKLAKRLHVGIEDLLSGEPEDLADSENPDAAHSSRTLKRKTSGRSPKLAEAKVMSPPRKAKSKMAAPKMAKAKIGSLLETGPRKKPLKARSNAQPKRPRKMRA